MIASSPAGPRCPVCAAAAGRRLRAFGAANPAISLQRCLGCGSEFLDPQPSDEALAREYRGYFGRRHASVARPRRDMFVRILRDVGADLAGLGLDRGSVLDVGAGEGDAVAAVQQLWPGARVTALEANPEAAAALAGLACTPVTASLEEWLAGCAGSGDGVTAPHDLVLLCDVLEHLRDPRRTLADLATAALAPGGRLVATFPSVDSASRAVLGPLWPQYKLEHLHYFSRAGALALVRGAGLEPIRLEPLEKRLPLDYLLAVGSSFGPALLRPPCRALRYVLPGPLGRAALRLPLGEWLLVARRPAP